MAYYLLSIVSDDDFFHMSSLSFAWLSLEEVSAFQVPSDVCLPMPQFPSLSWSIESAKIA